MATRYKNLTWRGLQYVNGTLEEMEQLDIQVLRDLLDESDPTPTQPDTYYSLHQSVL